jgi:hypothetical protein
MTEHENRPRRAPATPVTGSTTGNVRCGKQAIRGPPWDGPTAQPIGPLHEGSDQQKGTTCCPKTDTADTREEPLAEEEH